MCGPLPFVVIHSYAYQCVSDIIVSINSEYLQEKLNALVALGNTALYDAVANASEQLSEVASLFPDCKRYVMIIIQSVLCNNLKWLFVCCFFTALNYDRQGCFKAPNRKRFYNCNNFCLKILPLSQQNSGHWSREYYIY